MNFLNFHQKFTQNNEQKNILDKPVKHSDCFKIVVILDESGSMEPIRDKMINSLNDLIMEQKQIKNRPCNFTFVKFNNIVNRVIENKNINEILPLSKNNYIPSGSTALYDAIGNTINWFRYERDVLMVIITDGQENASTKFKKSQINNMLDEKQKYCGWSYVYLCNDLSTSTQGNDIGFSKSNFASNCVVHQSNYDNFLKNDLNIAIKNFRNDGVSVQKQLNKKF